MQRSRSWRAVVAQVRPAPLAVVRLGLRSFGPLRLLPSNPPRGSHGLTNPPSGVYLNPLNQPSSCSIGLASNSPNHLSATRSSQTRLACLSLGIAVGSGHLGVLDFGFFVSVSVGMGACGCQCEYSRAFDRGGKASLGYISDC